MRRSDLAPLRLTEEDRAELERLSRGYARADHRLETEADTIGEEKDPINVTVNAYRQYPARVGFSDDAANVGRALHEFLAFFDVLIKKGHNYSQLAELKDRFMLSEHERIKKEEFAARNARKKVHSCVCFIAFAIMVIMGAILLYMLGSR